MKNKLLVGLLTSACFFALPVAAQTFQGPVSIAQPTTAGHCVSILTTGSNQVQDTGAPCDTGAATSIVVGTTPVTGGTSGRIEYNNAGILGEMTTSGTGTQIPLTHAPQFLGTIGNTVSGGTGYVGIGAPAQSGYGLQLDIPSTNLLANEVIALGSTATNTPTGTVAAATAIFGGVINSTWAGTVDNSANGLVYGSQNEAFVTNSAKVLSAYGAENASVFTGSAGAAVAFGTYSHSENQGSGTIGEFRGEWISNGNSGGGSVTLARGVYINPLVGTTIHAVDISSQTSCSTCYAIYTSAGLVHFGDALDGTTSFFTGQPITTALGVNKATQTISATTMSAGDANMFLKNSAVLGSSYAVQAQGSATVNLIENRTNTNGSSGGVLDQLVTTAASGTEILSLKNTGGSLNYSIGMDASGVLHLTPAADAVSSTTGIQVATDGLVTITNADAQNLILSGGGLGLDNNKRIYIKDAGGTYQTVLTVDSSSQTGVRGAGAGIIFQDQSGNNLASMTEGANSIFQIRNNIASTGVTLLKTREGAGQSTSDSFEVTASDGTTKRFAVNSGGPFSPTYILTAAAPTVSAAQIGLGGTTAAVANCGSLATACMVINVAGTIRYIPYF